MQVNAKRFSLRQQQLIRTVVEPQKPAIKKPRQRVMLFRCSLLSSRFHYETVAVSDREACGVYSNTPTAQDSALAARLAAIAFETEMCAHSTLQYTRPSYAIMESSAVITQNQ